MMTFNEKNRRVSPLASHACAFAKSGPYFRELKGQAREVLMVRGDCGNNPEVRKAGKSKQTRLETKMRQSNDVVGDLKWMFKSLL